ncbi:WASH complex subunit 2A isoform X2 [Brachyhypopomus gauderio]|uniref:WASH complex subunit 2A isoform X2 n=1 Tax=Brachyhypopomus gauderio TaxID=698409 RepID=UPI004041DCD4
MADHMENGPSSYNGGTEQVWERPWTLDEMRKTSTNWSLAADSGLFLYLQDFSQKMMSKTHEIEKQLDGLIRDTKATDSCLHTVFNDFLMLSNTQFIENRVYDDEMEEPVPKLDTQERQPEQDKTREQKEAELIPKVQEAVNYGLKVLDSAFEQLDIKAGNSDSEDEEAADREEPILEPKDLYVDRPLPYLIGSQAFMEQDDIGLGDLSSDEMSVDSDRESVLESDEGQDGEHSDEDFDQEDEGRGTLKKKPSLVSYDEDEDDDDEDSDIFGESDKDEDEPRRDEVGPTSFADELAARITGDRPVKPEADSTSVSSGPSVNKKKTKGTRPAKAQVEEHDDNDEMFKPPKMEEDEYSPFRGKGGLFSGGTGLFDDDDEGDLFSEAPKNEQVEKEQTLPQKTESGKSKKIPIGAVSIFPDKNLFSSANTSDSLENKEIDSPVKSKVQAALKPASVGTLFDDNEEDDDIFSGKTHKKPTPSGTEKSKQKKTMDLFGGDDDNDNDEDGDIFSASSRVDVSQHSKKTVETEEAKRPPEKKLPAGATSVFGPSTKNILVEGLKKRRPSTSEESEKSVESLPKPDVVKPSAAMKTPDKSQNTSLFSDDEDSQIFPTIPKSHSKPEVPTQSLARKTQHSIFDDDDEEDLFSSVPKSKSSEIKTATLQSKTAVPSALFSDDEDQWMSSGSPATEVRSGGMKTSTSAPSRLLSAKLPQKTTLFEDHDDDLFAVTKESSQKKPQRVSLLFEDEDDEDKGSLFGFQSSPNKTATGGKGQTKVVLSSPENVAEDRPSDKTPVLAVPSSEEKEERKKEEEEEEKKKKKPCGAVSLFGGVNVLGDGGEAIKKRDKSLLEDVGGLDWQKEPPPPLETTDKKTKKTTLSLFDDEDDEEEPNGVSPGSIATQPTDKSMLKCEEQKPRVKSTGVFQDEELLFSQTQQRDNDPDVDLFAPSADLSAPLTGSVKPAGPTLFGEEDDDDDLFSSAKPKAPPKIPVKPSKLKKAEAERESSTVSSADSEKPAGPVKSKETSSRIGKLQASLAINPSSLLPGAAARGPGTGAAVPGPAGAIGLPSASAGTPEPRVLPSDGGVSFDGPAQVTTLQNANKDRVKGATRRRPQTRAARQLAAGSSEEAFGAGPEEHAAPQVSPGAATASSLPAFSPVLARPSALTLPVTTTTAPAHRHAGVEVRPRRPPSAEDDLFASGDLFTSPSLPKNATPQQPKAKASEDTSKKNAGSASEKDPTVSIFNDHGDDLFATVKTKPVKKAKAVPFLDDEEDDADIFRTDKRKDSKAPANLTKTDMFQDAKETPSKGLKKTKGRSLNASLFDDNVDIFADLTPTTKTKEKKLKKKVETKSIFDDDMDDIFSSGVTKPVGAASSQVKKPTQEPNSAEELGHSIFDDPLNVFGGD